MADSKLMNTGSPASPPPNCAICLGSCSNKCFSDTCMHQFCFNCLLQWSKIKAECPLCKQPFKSIIHNVKSNEEYEEHIVEPPRPVHLLDNDSMVHLILPHSPPPASRHHRFHFRTTFTVNTHGENAIQRMLMSHSLTNGITISDYLPHSTHYIRPRRRHNRPTTTGFRRSIYESNLWSSVNHGDTMISLSFRPITPDYFRQNPTARGRLVPWLNRELNALLRENTQQVMELVDRIMDYLLRHHIRSATFKNLLRSHLGARTDHFLHEFYNFMRSPYDMIGYDRHVHYCERPTTPTPFIDVSEDDSSDVMIVEENPEVIEVHSSDSDDDVIMTSSFVPKPRVLSEDSSSRRGRRVSVSSSTENEDQQREEGRSRKRKHPKRSRKDDRDRKRVSRDQNNDSDDDDSSSSVLDDVPLAKYLRIKASIGKKLMKRRAESKERKQRKSGSRKADSRKNNNKPTDGPSCSYAPSKAHCSKYQPRRRESGSSSRSCSSSSSSSAERQSRHNRNRSRSSSSNSSGRTPTPRFSPVHNIRTAPNNNTIVESNPCYDRAFANRLHGEIASMFRGRSMSPGEGPSNASGPYFPINREHTALDTRDTSVQAPEVDPQPSSRVFNWRDTENRREKISRDVMNRYREHLMNQQVDGSNVASSSSSSSGVYMPSNDRTYQPPSFYNDRSSPDLIDLSVTSRVKHESPLSLACVPQEVRAIRVPNPHQPSTSYALYNYDGLSNFKSEPAYSEYQSEGSTKYWTDLSTQMHTNSNDSSYNYPGQLPRKSVIQNSHSVPPQNTIISPRWSSSNSPSYPSVPENWSDTSD